LIIVAFFPVNNNDIENQEKGLIDNIASYIKTNTDIRQPNKTTKEGLITITSEGIEREFFVDLPASYNIDNKLPLVLSFHGSGGTYQRQASFYADLVDRDNFIGVFPQGLNGRWNSVIVNTVDDVANDVKFISEIIDYLIANYSVDEDRIYALGNSNGGGLVHRLGVEMPNTFAAIVAMSASVENGLAVDHQYSQSILQIHGQKDQTVPYYGGKGPFGIEFMSAENSIAFWAESNGCQSVPQVDKSKKEFVIYSYGDCRNDVSVQLLTIVNGNHGIGAEYKGLTREELALRFVKDKKLK
jgi:polyhydroxybutyrate depolymerase